jgi:hypothetical protein
LVTFALSIEVSDVPDLLGCQKHSNLIQEEIEEMRGEDFGKVGVELRDKLIDVMEGFHSFAVHLLLDLIEDLIRFVFPIHPKLQILINIFI